MTDAQKLLKLKKSYSNFNKGDKIILDFIEDLLDFNIMDWEQDADYEGVEYSGEEIIEHASSATLNDLIVLGRKASKLV